MHDFKLCDHFIRRKESIKVWQVFISACIMDRGGLSELGNSVRSIDIKLLTEIGPVKHQYNIHVIYANVSGRFQSITNCRLDHRWQGENLMKLEHWVLDQNLAMSVSALCHVLCALQPMKNSLVRPEWVRLTLNHGYFKKFCLISGIPKKSHNIMPSSFIKVLE